MSLGDFAAFNAYLAIMIFPIMVIGFMSNLIAQADASYQRLRTILDSEPEDHPGRLAPLTVVSSVSATYRITLVTVKF